MPELPEVEVTRRALAPALAGRTVRAVNRRGKYLLLDCGDGHLIVHLGMSGSLRLLAADTPAQKHDHFDLVLGDRMLRLRDPRRFGAVLWTSEAPEAPPLLAGLGVEPLSSALAPAGLPPLTRRCRMPVKQFVMDARRIVGVGNIYASESLFRAGIHPRRRAQR